MQIKEKIIERIKLLFNLGKSPNENEAASAINMAKKLMEDHKISEHELGNLEKTNLVRKELGPYIEKTEHTSIMMIVQKFFFVQIYTARSKRTSKRIAIVFVGKENDIDIAIFIYITLLKLFKKWYAKTKKIDNTIDRESFMVGMSLGILDQLEKDLQNKNDTDKNKLMIIREKIENEADEYMKQKNISVGTIHCNIKEVESESFQSGYQCGSIAEIFNKLKKEKTL
jgi:hypothetical protein